MGYNNRTIGYDESGYPPAVGPENATGFTDARLQFQDYCNPEGLEGLADEAHAAFLKKNRAASYLVVGTGALALTFLPPITLEETLSLHY